MWRGRGFAAATAAVVLGVGVAACGSDDDGASNSASAASGSSSAASQQGLEKAKANVAEFHKVPDDIGTHEALAGPVRGKRIAYIQCTTNICATGGKNFKEAAQTLGMAPTIISVGPSPDAAQKALNTAVAGHFDAVHIGLIPTVLVKSQLAQLKRQGVPVIAGSHQAEPNPAVVGEFLGPETIYRVGTLAANTVIADAGGKAKVVYLWTPEFPGLKRSLDGFTDTMKANCPDCHMDVLNVKTTDIGTGIPKQVVSYLQTHPDVAYVDCQFGDLFTGLPQALKTAGLADKVKLIDNASSPVNFQYTKQGQQFATIGSFIDVLAWQTADQIAKVLAGQKFDEPPYPIQLLYPKDVTFDTNGQPPFGDPNWRDQFKKLWAKGL